MLRPLRLALLLSMVGCPPVPVVPTPDADSSPPIAPPDAEGPEASATPKDAKGPVVRGTACAVDCSVFDFVGCREGRPSPEGRTCVEVCSIVDSVPGINHWPHDCIARARSVDEVRACKNESGERVRCPTSAK